MYRRALTILTVAITAGLIGVLGVGILAAQTTSAERTIDEMMVAAGEKVTVAIAAANYGLGGTVTETLPGGFTYVPLSSSLDTDDSQVRISGQEVTFVLIGGDVSFTYEVTTSDTEPPPYTFSGQLSGVDGSALVTGHDTVTLTGDGTVPVDEVTPEPGDASALRTIQDKAVAAGEKVTVTIDAANYGLGGTVTETLPGGFTYVPLSSSLDTDDIQVKISGQDVTFVLIGGDVSFTYEVTASTTARSYSFSGQLNGVDGSASVTGDDTVTVEGAAPEPGAASAERSLDMTTVAPEGQLTVTITAANYGLGGAVTETLPDGFSYVPLSSNLDTDDIQVKISGQDVTFVLIGENVSFTYEVTASMTAGPYSFSGQLDGVDGSAPVRGDSSVTVGATATRTFDRATVAPGNQLTVTITAANYGLGGTVTETLPGGFSYIPLSSNLDTDDIQVKISGQDVTFVLIGGDVSFTYRVTASSTARSYNFSGQLNGVDGSAPVVGASRVTVGVPQPRPTSRPSDTSSDSGSGGGGGGGGGGTVATATPTPAPTATPTPAPTPAATATATPAPTATSAPTPTPRPAPTATTAPTATPTTAPAPTATTAPTATPTTAPAATPTTAPAAPAATSIPAPTATTAPTATPTTAPAPTATATPEEEGGAPVLPILLIIAALVALVGGSVLYIRSRR